MTAYSLLVILSDEHQACAMDCGWHPFVKTPQLDAQAACGALFKRLNT